MTRIRSEPRHGENGERGADAAPIYGINERPARLWESLLYGWQHTLVDISPFLLPLAVASALGMDAAGQGQMINACLVAMGLATLLQTTLGNRLPIIQGPSATLTGTLAPLASQLGGPAMWGGIVVGGLVEMALGASRVLGALRRFLPVAVSGSVVLVIGLSLGQLAMRLWLGTGQGRQIALGALVIGVIFLMQTLGRNVLGGLLSRAAIFLSIWIVGLGVGGALGEVRWELVAEKAWFAVPNFFPHGGPGFGWELSLAAVLVVLAGYFGSMVESLGDYAATCAVAREPYTEKHMNRGIFAEGLGSVLAAGIGALPCTSYSQNIGIIAATRVASRFVVQIAACFLLAYGLCPKFGALLVAMPRSVLGGVFVVVCALICSSGIRLLAKAPATNANGLVIGTTLVCSLATPMVMQASLGATWLGSLPSFLSLAFGNSVVLAVLLGVGLNLFLVVLPGETQE